MAHHSILVVIGVYCSVLNILVVTKDSLFLPLLHHPNWPRWPNLLSMIIASSSEVESLRFFQVKWDRREGNSGGQDWWWHHISSSFLNLCNMNRESTDLHTLFDFSSWDRGGGIATIFTTTTASAAWEATTTTTLQHTKTINERTTGVLAEQAHDQSMGN